MDSNANEEFHIFIFTFHRWKSLSSYIEQKLMASVFFSLCFSKTKRVAPS